MSLLAALILSAGVAFVECANDDEIAGFVADYISNTPTMALSRGGTMEDALCTQAKLVRAPEAHMGPVIGYKAGLTSKPAQERFKVSERVQGVPYKNMMLQDGAAIPVADAVAMSDMLAQMQVTLAEVDGETLAQVPGKSVLGHPANSILWLSPKASSLHPAT